MNVFDAADPQLAGPLKVQGIIIYTDKPRSLRGRLANLVRRLFRRDEQGEVLAYLPVDEERQ